MTDTNITDNNFDDSLSNSNNEKDKYYNLKAGVFLTSVAGMAAVGAFGATLVSARKQDPDSFNKGLVHSYELPENGVQLGLRALKWGTIYAIGGVGLFCATVWTISGASNMKEFRQKMGSILPRLSNRNPQGRTEFEGLTDLLDYITTDYSTTKPPTTGD